MLAISSPCSTCLIMPFTYASKTSTVILTVCEKVF
ncbi:hypothetical protein SPAB_01583 [Salmonella enterica subsp. enterica serovar Paratyphi B str. SPB7]|uniref:Uncharacterized protein n=1 Tax=Salmonella paratyphi B (strain ATCC BAA-1250 / SPB7) TaxID=1016998 RepID=A0A6C6Z081_SALPB|nr:hypothetical protein SPAB_01583 [Salmonella enterica subsp. enterica serovar Paratyphi B str. SPB7]